MKEIISEDARDHLEGINRVLAAFTRNLDLSKQWNSFYHIKKLIASELVCLPFITDLYYIVFLPDTLKAIISY